MIIKSLEVANWFRIRDLFKFANFVELICRTNFPVPFIHEVAVFYSSGAIGQQGLNLLIVPSLTNLMRFVQGAFFRTFPGNIY